ncbi:MAG: ATP-binding cassette domain-containing protein [Roseburia sp.]
MLQIKDICKQYKTGELVQTALDHVSLNLRDNEFVAILGPSGSGKTTLLNVIGGLDRYDSGDLVINSISTKNYKDRDWDSYRNHTIGFVFQSYNLIPHQTVLANVELALTISGISKGERRRRAKEALEQVGLGNQLHKKPNQMSGGQMQRVAIARALVNNPDILLADEPTGALDTETSVQVMDLLKKVAKDRLVVMVTHNPELAEAYATRIVKLKDGHIMDDTDPYEIDESKQQPAEHKNMGKSSMSIFTALSLSFNNLKTKKGRTILTAFAGSIGIIGIAMILSLSNGVNNYIDDIQKSTMTSYPISIGAQTMDLTDFIAASEQATGGGSQEADHELDAVYSDGTRFEMASSLTTSITENNLTDFKKYLDAPDSEIWQYIGENGVIYSYDTQFDVYAYDSEDTLVNADGGVMGQANAGAGPMGSMMSQMSSVMPGTYGNFSEMMRGTGNQIISQAVTDRYDVLYGEWPDAYDEVVLVLNRNNEISQTALYQLGILPDSEYQELMDKIGEGEEVEIDTESFSYEDICQQTFYLIPACDRYTKTEGGLYQYVEDDTEKMEELLDNAVELKISGIIRPKEDEDNALLESAVGYTAALTDYLIDYSNSSDVVQDQMDSPDINVLNGAEFSPADDEAKIADAKNYLAMITEQEKADICRDIMLSYYGETEASQQMMAMTDIELATALDSYTMGEDSQSEETLLMIYDNYISSGNYDDNLSTFGYVSPDAPSEIDIYTDSFEDKEYVSDCIEHYNEGVSEENQITYTDYVGLLMSSVTTIINVISYVLIAFVAVSLVVSSIMIGIITFISVLERTKEIGILRAIGASKRNISQVFNAETFIIGLCSGVMGIVITELLIIPINAVIHRLTGLDTVNAVLPVAGACILILLSVILTLIGGWIPAKKAAKKDPVTALRTE